jgi:hypothetical protein
LKNIQTAVAKRDLLVAWLALLVAAFAAGLFRIREFDTFWHLVSGRWILEHRALPHTDPFRFSSAAEPWTDHEWLFQVFLSWVEQLGGLDGLIVVRALIVATLATVLLLALRHTGVSLLTAFLLALCTLVLSRLRFLIRPELASLLGLAVLLATLQQFRRDGRMIRLIVLAGVVVFWANAHLGVLVVPPLAALYLIGTRLPGGTGSPNRGGQPPSWSIVVGAPLLFTAAIAINPNGIGVFGVPGKIAAALHDLAGVNPEWLPLLSVPLPWVFVAMALLISTWVIEWRRIGSIDCSTALVAVALAALTMMSVRHRGLFYIAAAFAFAESLAAIQFERQETPAPPRRALWPVLLSGAAVLGFVFPPMWGPFGVRDRISFGFGLEAGRYPVGAADAVSEWADLENVFNDVATGGYLLWRWYPERLVFIDGRNEVHPELLSELTSAVSTREGWQALLDRYDIDGAILDYLALPGMVLDGDPSRRLLPRVNSVAANAPVAKLPVAKLPATRLPGADNPAARSSLYFAPESFALVYWDDVAMLFVRRAPDREREIDAKEFPVVRPDEPGLLIAQAKGDEELRIAAIEELERRIELAPRSRRAETLLAALVAIAP